MSTPDQPETPPLTRRQLREIRNTGATPIVVPGAGYDLPTAVVAEPPATEPDVESEPDVQVAEAEPEVIEAEPEVTEAEPEAIDIAGPDADAEAQSDWREPVTSEQESDERREVERADDESPEPAIVDERQIPGTAPLGVEPHSDLGVAPLTRRQAREHERIRTASVPIIAPDVASAPAASVALDADEHPIQTAEAQWSEPITREPAPAPAEEAVVAPTERDDQAETPSAVVNPDLGSGLLAGKSPVVELPPSFDQLIARSGSATGSTSTPNALILSQTPSAAPLVAPVTATGEVLITGSFDLPEGLGSVGHGPGVHDGKDVDAVLVDGELPAASSPTPIAASAAVSTVRNNDEIIRPPAPEKGSRLVLALAITAGALLLTVVGLIGLAIATGAL